MTRVNRLERHGLSEEAPVAPTDEQVARQVALALSQAMKASQRTAQAVRAALDTAPGGVEAVLAILGREAASEAQDAMAHLVSLEVAEVPHDPLAGLDLSQLPPTVEVETPQERAQAAREAAQAAREATRAANRAAREAAQGGDA